MINLHVEYCLESEQMEVAGKMVFLPLKDERARARATSANWSSYYKKEGPDWNAIAACVKTIPDACEGQKQGKIEAVYDGERTCALAEHRQRYFKLLEGINTFLNSKL